MEGGLGKAFLEVSLSSRRRLRASRTAGECVSGVGGSEEEGMGDGTDEVRSFEVVSWTLMGTVLPVPRHEQRNGVPSLD